MGTTTQATPDAGFGFLRWLAATLDGRPFTAHADVQRAYARDGWAGVALRASEGAAAARGSIYAPAWQSVLGAATTEARRPRARSLGDVVADGRNLTGEVLP